MFDEREPAEPEVTPELKAIEGRLARLVPAGARVDRDRLMFEAGRAAERAKYEPSPSLSLRGRGNAWMWRVSTGFMTAASLVLATMLVWQRQAFEVALEKQNHVLPTVQVAAPPSDSESPAVAPAEFAAANRFASRLPSNGYLAVRYAALTRGIDALDSEDPKSGAVDAKPGLDRTQRDILNDLMPSANNNSHSRS